MREQEQRLDHELAYLSEQLRAECDRTESLKQEVEILGQEIGELEKELDDDSRTTKDLHERIDKLTKEWDRLARWKSDNLQNDLGLIAAYIEQAICCHVLPDVFVNELCPSLHDLLDYLNRSDEFFPLDPSEYNCKEILQVARKRWENVCENFNFPDEWKTKTGQWSKFIDCSIDYDRAIIHDHDCSVPGDIRAIEMLKDGMPYPLMSMRHISLKYAEQNVESMQDDLPPWQFKLVAAFVGSLREKMTKTGLQHDHILLD